MTLGLQLQGLSKSYGPQVVIDNVGFDVSDGQFVCILGPSGCGKSTLLRLIAGLEAPSAGRIMMNGSDLTATPTHRRNFAFVFQALALFPFLSVEENILYSLRLRYSGRREQRQRLAELLDLIQLPDIGPRPIHQLSGGQRQRVAIARALAQEPLLFLLDEPLSALDARLRDHLQIELRQLQKKLRITTILVTHDQREAMTLGDSIVVLADGRVQQIGAPSDIYRRPANRFVANFIGQNNLLDVRALDQGHVRFADRLVVAASLPDGARPGDDLVLSVRPEDIRVLPRQSDANHLLTGRISFMRDIGERIEVQVDCCGSIITAVLAPTAWRVIAAAESVSLQFDPAACVVLR